MFQGQLRGSNPCVKPTLLGHKTRRIRRVVEVICQRPEGGGWLLGLGCIEHKGLGLEELVQDSGIVVERADDAGRRNSLCRIDKCEGGVEK